MAKNWLRTKIILSLVLLLCCASCKHPAKTTGLAADAGNGGIELPSGFSALIVADNLGSGRHIAVRDNGDIYLALLEFNKGKGIVAIRDTTGDGKADIVAYFGDLPGTGIQIHKNHLYFAHDTVILRYNLKDDALLPDPDPEIIVAGFKREYQHSAKTIAFDTAGNLYVNIGAPSNACQVNDRTPGSPGIDPCPLLENYGGIWRFRDDIPNQTQAKDGFRFATGLRNCVAIEWNTAVNSLYVVQHGRDQLNLFPKLYSNEDNAELPAEEFFLLEEGDDCGWPYCYFDGRKGKKVLSPEYGGNGDSIGRCAEKKDPFMTFPAHTAPNDLIFYSSDQFPDHYRQGAFIAFHGSWNRAPLVQEGYYVVFVPFDHRLPAGDWEIFANDFAGKGPVKNPGDAVHRPMGLAQGPDGSLYVSDSEKGTVWRIFYRN